MNKVFRSLSAMFAVFCVVFLSGCDTVSDGTFGIGSGKFSGKYQDEIYSPGWYPTPLTKVTHISSQENLIQIVNVTPKDANNVLLQDLDISFTYRTNPKNAVNFLRERGGMTRMDNGIYMLGYEKLQKDGKSMVQTSTQKFTSEYMLANIKELENTFKEDLQKEINSLYGVEVFEILDVKISNIKVAPYIEDKVAQVEILKAEQQKNVERMQVIKSATEVKNAEAIMLKEAITASGLSVDQYLRNEFIKTIGEARADNQMPINVVVTMSSEK